jgi:heme O synthase-like polyprenyltransferase
MMKEYITTKNIGIFFILLLLGISLVFPEYNRYFTYTAIVIMIPLVVVELIKKRKEDKLNSTKIFQTSIYSMLVVAVILVVFFFITKQDV